MTSDEIILRLGGPAEAARLCQVSPQAVSQWIGIDPDTKEQRQIPKARLMYLEAVRPEVFRADYKPGDPKREKARA